MRRSKTDFPASVQKSKAHIFSMCLYRQWVNAWFAMETEMNRTGPPICEEQDKGSVQVYPVYQHASRILILENVKKCLPFCF